AKKNSFPAIHRCTAGNPARGYAESLEVMKTTDYADGADKGNDKNNRNRLSPDEDSRWKVTKETKIMFCRRLKPSLPLLKRSSWARPAVACKLFRSRALPHIGRYDLVGEFLEARIIHEPIEHRIEPEQRVSEWHVVRHGTIVRYRK